MKRIFLTLLPVVSILCFSCTKDATSTRTTNDTIPVPPPPPPPQPIDTLASGWERIARISTDIVSDIFFINNTGFAIAGAKILKSSDGGSTWSALTLPAGVTSLINIGMGSEKNAIFAYYGQLVSTRDGGISFTVSPVPDVNLTDVFFVDSITAYAAGASMWKTTDAGINWVKLDGFTGGGNNSYSSLYFLNVQDGWVFKNSGLYQTLNAGVDWQSFPSQTGNGQPQGIFFVNADTGYIANGRDVERTIDGGASWTTVFTGSGGGYMDIHFVSDKTGYVTDNTRIYKTEDGGDTWTSEVHLVSNMLIELHFIDANHGWACGADGTVLKYSR